MKKLALFLCIIILTTAIASCTNKEADNSQPLSSSEDNILSSEPQEESSEESSTEEFIMNYWVFGDGVNSAVDVKSGDYTKISDIDESILKYVENGYNFYSAAESIFEIGGIINPFENNNEYYRLDASKKSIYSGANSSLAVCTPGATIRFRTNASSFVVKVKLKSPILGMNHFTNRGVYGLDVYTGTGTNRIYCGAQMQMFAGGTSSYSETVALPGGYQEVTINLPLYSGVSEVLIGLPASSMLALPIERDFLPIAFYGSSITQGGCVSRPGNMYSNIICRALNADNLNLGFSGAAMGEQSVAEYIATREISAFVMDYDYNSPTAETLRSTHYDFYKTVRDAHPDIPIILVTHPYYAKESTGDAARKKVIKDTYDKAVADGDSNIYYVDSESFFTAQMRDLYAVDNLHPNDIGHFFMASAIFPVLEKALKNND